MLTATNKNRQAINDAVRERLIRQGEIDPNGTHTHVLVAKGGTQVEQQEAIKYRPGDVLRFGREYKSLGIAKGEYAAVERVDAESGLVHVSTAEYRSFAWRPERESKVEVYSLERREVAAADTIRFTRNGESAINGQTARAEHVGKGVAEIRLPSRERTTVDLDKQANWDHGYATTVHASHGRTVDYSAIHITGQAKAAFAEKSFYVALTRAREGATIYAEDRSAAGSFASAKQDKGGALDAIGTVRGGGEGQTAAAADRTRDVLPSLGRGR